MSKHNNNTAQFVFDSKIKLFTIALMAIGIVSLGITFAIDGEYNYIRFWTNILHNTVFFVGIAFAALLFIATHTMAWGGWQTLFKRVPEAMMTFLYVGVGLVALLGVAIYLDLPGTDLLYLWSDEAALDPENKEHFDALVSHKSTLLNPMTYFLTVVVVLIWSFFAAQIRKLSIKQDTTPYVVTEGDSVPAETKKTRLYAAIFLPVAGFSSAFVIWLWIMSVDPHWYSTLFAWYVTVSMWISCVCVMLLTILFLKSRGHLEAFSSNHMHDLGKYVFGFSVFWTYLWFSQFLLIWYANNGEETQYFFIRFEQFKPIFFINLGMNFILPFLILMMNSSKRTLGTLAFAAGLVLLGHWIDFYQMIKPGVWYNYEHAQHMSHGSHGHDDKGHGEHSSTYQLESNDKFSGGKAVLTDYQDTHNDQNHGDEHSDETHADDHNHGEDTTATPHTDETHNHDDHGDAHNHGDHGTTGGDHDHGDHEEHAHTAEHGPSFLMGIHFPGLLELGTMAGFLGLFLFFMFLSLSKAPLYPPNDPYIRESEHHEVWPYPAEGHDDHH